MFLFEIGLGHVQILSQRKLELQFTLRSFFFLSLFLTSLNLSYSLIRKNVVISGLLLLVDTLIF